MKPGAAVAPSSRLRLFNMYTMGVDCHPCASKQVQNVRFARREQGRSSGQKEQLVKGSKWGFEGCAHMSQSPMCFPVAMGNALATHTEPSAKLTTAHKAHHCDGHAPTQTRDYIIDSRRGGSPGGAGGGGGAAVAVARRRSLKASEG